MSNKTEPGLHLLNATGKMIPVLTESGGGDRDLLEEVLNKHNLMTVDTDPDAIDEDQLPSYTAVHDGMALGDVAVKLRVGNGAKEVGRTFDPDDAQKLGAALIAVAQHAREAEREIQDRESEAA